MSESINVTAKFLRCLPVPTLLAVVCVFYSVSTTASETVNWLKEGDVSFATRNIYWEDDYKNYDGDWHEWAQGIQIIYLAQTTDEQWGFDFAFYGVQKLDASYGSFSNRHPEQGEGGILLRDQQFNNNFSNSSGYGRLGEGAFRFNVRDDEYDGWLRVGYFRRKNSLTLPSNYSRAVPASYRGAEFEWGKNSFTFYGAWVDQIGRREANEFVDFATSKSEVDGVPLNVIDYIWNLGGKYRGNGWSLELDYSQSENYLKYARIDGSKSFRFSDKKRLKITVQYADLQRAGRKWDIGGAIQGAFTDDANLRVLAGDYSHYNTTFSLIYSETEAENTLAGGYLFYWMAGNEHGVNNFKSVAAKSEFNKNGEKALAIKVRHSFSRLGYENIALGAAYHQGKDIDLAGGAALRMDFEEESETYLDGSYRIIQGTLKDAVLILAIGRLEVENTINPNFKSDYIRMYFNIDIF